MKKNYALFFAWLIFAISTQGQSVIIGTGTANTNGNIADPIERYYNYTRFQIVYTAAELTAAGMPAWASINALGFSVSQSAVSLSNFTINMGLTMQSLADPYIPDEMTIVRSPFTYNPVLQAEGSFDMISFTTSFIWDGTSNIVINTCTGSNPYISPFGGLRYTPAPDGASRSIRNDGADYCHVVTVENSALKPNIKFDYTPGILCTGTPSPGNTISSANLVCPGFSFMLSLQNATPGAAVTYQWQTSPDGQAPWTNTGFSTPVLSAMQWETTYYRCQVTCFGNTGTSTPVAVSIIGFEYCYCSSGAALAGNEDITHVQVGTTLNNSSMCGSLTGSQNNATGEADLYSNFSTIPATDLQSGVMSPISVQITECDNTANGHEVTVYIDFDQNGFFTDPGEEFIIWPYASSNTHTITADILVPADAPPGNTLMRIVCSQYTPAGPCLVGAYGETEDYLINVVNSSGVPENLSVTGSMAGETCYNATNTITVAGGGTTFEVMSGDEVEMIAGISILFKDGTTVYPGGYLAGYITPDASYCPPVVPPSMPVSIAGSGKDSARESVKIHPNPTKGSFILEVPEYTPGDKVQVDIFGTLGNLLKSMVMTGNRTLECSLTDAPVGLYHLRVTTKSKTEILKIVRE
jgi:hypothetical protein